MFQNKNFLQNLFSQNKIDKKDQIVCFCTHGNIASSLFLQLMIAGYTNPKLYDDSFVDWNGRRFSLE